MAQKQNKIQKREIRCFADTDCAQDKRPLIFTLPVGISFYLLAFLPCDRQNVSGTYFENQFIYQLTLVKCSAARRESITSQRDADLWDVSPAAGSQAV